MSRIFWSFNSKVTRKRHVASVRHFPHLVQMLVCGNQRRCLVVGAPSLSQEVSRPDTWTPDSEPPSTQAEVLTQLVCHPGFLGLRGLLSGAIRLGGGFESRPHHTPEKEGRGREHTCGEGTGDTRRSIWNKPETMRRRGGGCAGSW